MAAVDQLARAALSHDALQTRALAQELLRTYQQLHDVPPPDSCDPREQSVAAALVELLAQRRSQEPPGWSAGFGPLSEPFHLLEAAMRMPRLRVQCETESPLPLRKRNLYAPSNFLTFA